ncbi:DUF2589 domain-containing protein [Pelagibius sp. CAU 1746]|uniref:DUF2589 domain-containing protein n=1 Tax=Pelagibius sp. CAU 1746 TaxID=3140370 RepID=UPI00325B8FA8
MSDDTDKAAAASGSGGAESGGAASGGNGNGGSGNGVLPGGAPELPEPQSGVLSLAQLIGAPIHALVDAEAQSAMATARFVRAVGFTGPKEGEPGGMGDLGDLQMARFTRRRRSADGTEEDVEVQIPLLSMLPIPALQIKDAELDYTVKIVQTEALPQRQAEVNQLIEARGAGPLREPPATLRAAFAREPRAGDRRSVDMLVKMKLRIEQADMPGGLAQLLALAAETTRQTPLPPPPSETPPAAAGNRDRRNRGNG